MPRVIHAEFHADGLRAWKAVEEFLYDTNEKDLVVRG